MYHVKMLFIPFIRTVLSVCALCFVLCVYEYFASYKLEQIYAKCVALG